MSPDSIRLYVDNDPNVKGVKGGFAIGGFDNTKGKKQDLLTVSSDSTRIYIKTPEEGGATGGFAIGGFDNTLGTVTSYTSLNPKNYFIGQGAGRSNTTGLYNSFIGFESGASNTIGEFNIFMGHHSGYSNIDGVANMFMGDSSGFKNTSGFANVFLGPWAGLDNSTGYYNVSLGYQAGAHSTTGWQNINIGVGAGMNSTGGNRNIFLGVNSGFSNADGAMNIFVGNFAGYTSIGSNNVYIGSYAGRYNSTGSNNVFIGNRAAMDETASNKLYIDNTRTALPLIYGDFTDGAEMLVFNGNVGIGATPGYKFQVGVELDGSAAIANEWLIFSDSNLKTGFTIPDDPLKMISELNGYYFYWKNGSDKERQFGFSAQEVEKVLPEIVSRGIDGYLSMEYGKIAPLLVEGMKEQQKQIENQRKEIDELKALVNALVASQPVQARK